MSMSTWVVGIIPADGKFREMKQIHENCRKHGIPIPPEVDEYFDGEYPDEKGIKKEIKSREWGDDNSAGIEIEVGDIPKDVKTIRFINSW